MPRIRVHMSLECCFQANSTQLRASQKDKQRLTVLGHRVAELRCELQDAKMENERLRQQGARPAQGLPLRGRMHDKTNVVEAPSSMPAPPGSPEAEADQGALVLEQPCTSFEQLECQDLQLKQSALNNG